MKQMPKMQEVVFDAKGEEKKRSEPKNIDPNIRDDTPPIKWTGKFFDKKEAIRNFVFRRSLQLQHTNGLTYDFLFNMANDLQKKGQLMFVGAGLWVLGSGFWGGLVFVGTAFSVGFFPD